MIWSNFSSAAPDLWLIGRANAASPERARGLPKVDGSLKQDGYASFFDDVANALLGDGGHGMPDAEGKRRTIARRDLRGRFSGLAEKAALLRVTHPIGYAYDGGEGDLALLADVVRLVAGFNGLVVEARYLRALTTAAMTSRLGARPPSFPRGKMCSRSPASSCTSSCRTSCSSWTASLSNTRGGCTR